VHPREVGEGRERARVDDEGVGRHVGSSSDRGASKRLGEAHERPGLAHELRRGFEEIHRRQIAFVSLRDRQTARAGARF
jgi:hypothetical protein